MCYIQQRLILTIVCHADIYGTTVAESKCMHDYVVSYYFIGKQRFNRSLNKREFLKQKMVKTLVFVETTERANQRDELAQTQ